MASLVSRPPTPYNQQRSGHFELNAPSAWTQPFWTDVGIDSVAIMEVGRWNQEVWAWTLMETMEALCEERAGPAGSPSAGRALPTRIAWLDEWEAREGGLVEELDGQGSLYMAWWFAERFHPRTDWWRARVGWHREIDLSKAFEWEYPHNQQGEMVARLAHPREPSLVFEVGVPVQVADRGDPSRLIQMYWLKQFWIWRGDYDYVPNSPSECN